MWYQTRRESSLAGGLAAGLALVLVSGAAAAEEPAVDHLRRQGRADTRSRSRRPGSSSRARVPQVKALIAKLKKKKSTTDLANYYAGIIGNQSGLAGLKAYRFQAFDWPGQPRLAGPDRGVGRGRADEDRP